MSGFQEIKIRAYGYRLKRAMNSSFFVFIPFATRANVIMLSLGQTASHPRLNDRKRKANHR